MSTGNINLDLLLSSIYNSFSVDEQLFPSALDNVAVSLQHRYPRLSDREAREIGQMLYAILKKDSKDSIELVATVPPSFSIKAKTTVNTVVDLINSANKSVLLTGYSLSEYFSDVIDLLIQKSKKGILVKFFANGLQGQPEYEKLIRHKGRFLRIYDYQKKEDRMSALHAKVISVDQRETLITSANLSYHGQEGNIEIGTLITSAEIAKEIEDLFTTLLFKHVFVNV